MLVTKSVEEKTGKDEEPQLLASRKNLERTLKSNVQNVDGLVKLSDEEKKPSRLSV